MRKVHVHFDNDTSLGEVFDVTRKRINDSLRKFPGLARRLKITLEDDGRRLDLAYRLTLGRLPTAGERAIGQQFLASAPGTTAWPQLVQALFASMDFRYVE